MKKYYAMNFEAYNEGQVALYSPECREFALTTCGDIVCTESDSWEDCFESTPWIDMDCEAVEKLFVEQGKEISTEEQLRDLNSFGLEDWVNAKEQA